MAASVSCVECDVCGEAELSEPIWDEERCDGSADERHTINPDTVRPDDGGVDLDDGPARVSVECRDFDTCGDAELLAPVWDE